MKVAPQNEVRLLLILLSNRYAVKKAQKVVL